MTELFSRIESASALDRPSDSLRDTISKLTSGTAGALLRGDIAPGHPLHPALVTVPIGTWTAALLFDFAFEKPDAARRLIGVGLAGAVPTIVTGWTDFAECTPTQRRVGLVHAAVNATGVSLLGLSYLDRRRGRRPVAVAASTVGTVLIGLGGLLGGHLAYVLGARVEHPTVEQSAAVAPSTAVDSTAMDSTRS